MKFYVIEDASYGVGADPFSNPTNNQGICIDPTNNLWLVPKTEIPDEDPRIVSDKLKLKKIDIPESKYYKRYMVTSIPSGSVEIEMTDTDLIYADLEEAQIPLSVSTIEVTSKKLSDIY